MIGATTDEPVTDGNTARARNSIDQLLLKKGFHCMDKYPKLFAKMALIYLVIGVCMGMAIGVFPELSVRIHFFHIHLNLLGFVIMMIASVAYHVLPRFNARPVPWPDGVKYHFFFHNIGLVGMGVTHLAGGLWASGWIHGLFSLFAVSAGTGLLIMAYNLFGVLLPEKTPANDSPSCSRSE
jgi:cbb3-type cytochrome oxidase subunit 1